MERVLVQVGGLGRNPDAARIARRLGVSADDLDSSYGVVLIDPKRELVAVLVDKAALDRAKPGSNEGTIEIFSNPKIAPFER